ncbi:sigma 54-interacting transcriptional regulator [Domibacillus sp. 8LH]|uniref:sigma-54 interaction domain-containing protein n=1 Tax=Domibacillus sp. 8LH TaxID=3073900 RepID=UPI00317AA682
MGDFIRENILFYLEAILKISKDAVTAVDKTGKVVYWNEAAENTYQIKADDIVGKNIEHYFQRNDIKLYEILKDKQPVFDVYHQPWPDKHILISSSPVFDRDGSLIGAISVDRDITATVKLNDELSVTHSKLQDLKQQVINQAKNLPFSSIKGSSKSINQIKASAAKVAKTDATVLILGESGVGKELFAQAIHESSSRKTKPFVPINCGAIPSPLFESEFFGYDKGSFTGAEKGGKAGKLEEANGGTLFLDELGTMPLDIQVKFLRTLQEGEVYRVGGTKPIKVDIRVIAATNSMLEKMVEQGEFREDLYYRLNVVPLHIPSLRERLEDIPELVNIFIEEFSIKYQKEIKVLSQDVMELFSLHHWPGNVRELRNFVERLVVMTDDSVLQASEILSMLPAKEKLTIENTTTTFQDEISLLEKERIKKVLEKTYGNKTLAAKELGFSRVTLYKKITKHGL